MDLSIFRNPFANFAPPLRQQSPLRQAITAAYRKPETECLPPLIAAARQPLDAQKAIAATGRELIEGLRAKPAKSGMQSLLHEFQLGSQEGVALMCLAEALLRIPDAATRDALIRDKLSVGDWSSHIGQGRSLFVNAATWGLVVAGKLTATADDANLSTALTRLLGRLGEPVIRAGVDVAMRMLGEQFVTGQTIDEALTNSEVREKRGYRFSFDMLGEAAATDADAQKYFNAYESAIRSIGRNAVGGPLLANGISIKLSALHPRFARSQAKRVEQELLPRLKSLARLAKEKNIGLNIDAEESDRLELSLDLLESLCFDEYLKGWNGIGFVVQAYGKRCPEVLDFIIDLARRSRRRIMVRLVKGAYWDSEIKRAQVDGLTDYPVFTRKIHTDVSYIACAQKLLRAPEAVYPQFATHNAQTVATILHMAGPTFAAGDYEFQCLHGMGETLFDQLISQRPVRIYAPVGTHETLLAYLVRRLLENGANASFVHRIADLKVPIDELLVDPAELAAAMPVVGAPHEKLVLPAAIFGQRPNSQGLDLANENVLAKLTQKLSASAGLTWFAGPLIAGKAIPESARPVSSPADRSDRIGEVRDSSPDDVSTALRASMAGAAEWQKRSASDRAVVLAKAADLLQDNMQELMGLIIREAGKTAGNAIGEVREAVDFLRYYAMQARALPKDARPLGTITCISPWNFPLAIFTGQIAAALAAGNTVLAKPAEETPLIAYAMVKLLHDAGVPTAALQFLPGDGAVGAALVAAPETAGVMFTGSTEVARLINATLAKRLSAEGKPIPLVAETGGQNAMIVDSSALPEQVVADVLVSAFDSAGQRCSALRLLCLQEDVADHILLMLKGAMQELRVGNPAELATDIGPIITPEAAARITAHVDAMRTKGHRVTQVQLGAFAGKDHFVAPTIIEINAVSDLGAEVFGPVLHVLRFKRNKLDQLVDSINGTGYALTFGLHTRLDETIQRVTSRIKAGNIYINRTITGAVVGVQPFGGGGLSGTGPKAGGPLALYRLIQNPPNLPIAGMDLEGPVGERNFYALHPRGRILCLASSHQYKEAQRRTCEETGNTAVFAEGDWTKNGPYAAALVDAKGAELSDILQKLAGLPGAIVVVHAAPYCHSLLFEEVSTSINTTAAGGNASLLSIG